MRNTPIVLLGTLLVLLLVGEALAGQPTPDQLRAAARSAGSANGLCPVTSKLVVPAGGTANYKGERIAFAESGAAATFRADPTRYMDRLRLNPPKYWYVSRKPSVVDMRKAKKAVGSANGSCPLTSKLVLARGGLADYKGQRIGFCCPNCRAKFMKGPERHMRAMRADPLAFAYDRPGPTNAQMRVARRNAGTANGRCPVSGGLVSSKGAKLTYGGETIGMCSGGCAAKFQANPEQYMQRMRAEPIAYGYVSKR